MGWPGRLDFSLGSMTRYHVDGCRRYNEVSHWISIQHGCLAVSRRHDHVSFNSGDSLSYFFYIMTYRRRASYFHSSPPTNTHRRRHLLPNNHYNPRQPINSSPSQFHPSFPFSLASHASHSSASGLCNHSMPSCIPKIASSSAAVSPASAGVWISESTGVG